MDRSRRCRRRADTGRAEPVVGDQRARLERLVAPSPRKRRPVCGRPARAGVDFLDHPEAAGCARSVRRGDDDLGERLCPALRAERGSCDPLPRSRARAGARNPRTDHHERGIRESRVADRGSVRALGRVRGARQGSPVARHSGRRSGARPRGGGAAALPRQVVASAAPSPRSGDAASSGRQLIVVIAINLAAWIATGLGFLALLNGLSDEPSPGLTWAIATYSVGYLIGFVVPFLPGGLGAREGALVAVLVSRYGAGAATGISLATRLAVTPGEALAVCLIWLVYLAARALPGGRSARNTR
ncbi:MAG: lysylphosphatidylglycerol synthase domain-containing protein [Gaiellaceae bacterium]